MRLMIGILLVLLSACDSPRNNQIHSFSALQKNQKEFALKNFNIRLSPSWAEGPYGHVLKSSVLLLSVYNEQNQLVDIPSDHYFTFFATMPSMGHPLDQPGEFIRIAKGIYYNNSIRFNMAGDWLMEVSVINSQDEIVEQVVWQEFF